ncbi:MAG TPA: PAS domain-containing protein [Candidatus Didemnitutus sp.]|nr:PAS domain-containing protein [Candidatus Didemnitutus sp.]
MLAESRLRRVGTTCAALTAGLGAMAVMGWVAKIEPLKGSVAGWRPMSIQSATCFVLCGTALLLASRRTPNRIVTGAIMTLSIAVCYLAGSALVSSIFSVPPMGFDAVLRDATHQAVLRARAPLNTTLPFLMAGFGILGLGLPRRAWLSLTSWLGLAVTSHALLNLLAFSIDREDTPSRMAMISVFGFLFLGTAMITSRMDSRMLRVFDRNHPLGFIALRLLALGIFGPLLIYVLGLWLLLPMGGTYIDLLILIVLLVSILLLGALVSSLQRMELLDEQRREAVGSRDVLLARLQNQTANLEVLVAERTRRLHETTERMQLALHSGDYGVWDYDVTTGRQVWDDRQYTIYGIKPSEFDGTTDTFMRMVHPDDRTRLTQRYAQDLANGQTIDVDFRIVRGDGSVRHINSRSFVHRDATGKAVRMVGINRDVTPEREREQAVSTLNQRLLFVLNATGYGVWEFDFATERMLWDDHLLEVYGLRREMLTGHVRDWHDRVHPEDLAGVQAEMEEALVSKRHQVEQQFRVVRPDGVVRHISSVSYVLRDGAGAPKNLVGFDRDVTGEHDLREELRITEERWKLALAGNNDGVWDWNITTGEFYRNPRYAEIIGYMPAELPPDRHIWLSFGHPDDIAGTNTALAEHLEGRTVVYQSEYRLRHRDGQWVWVLDRGKVVARDPRGQPLRVVGTQTDITPRKQLEERLRHGEEMSLQLGRLAQIGAWEWDLGTSHLTWSPEMFRIHEVELGYEPTLAKSLEFYPTQARSSLSEALQHAVRAGEGFDFELPFTTARGSKLWVRVLGRAEFKDGRAIRIYGAFQDITARRDAEEMRRQLESQLFQSQKMETLGTLAGGIAHDFNNLLTGILGYQDLALDSVPEGDPARNYLAVAREASMRARELVDQILTFSRQTDSEKVPVNLSQVVEDARRFLRATVPATIRIDVEITPGCGPVLADATQIHQVLLNLGFNATHAMQASGGVMRMALEPVVLDPAAAGLHHVEMGRYSRLTFSDTGHGMDAETCKRIFDPFFTTKEVGQGTGLGLSVVHGIIQAHRGSISVQSAPGKGATFTMLLPEAREDATELESLDTSMPRGHGELIAVVDDEDIVRSFAQMALEKLGYRVMAFDTPALCLEALRRTPSDYSILLTDQTMPVMNGIELATEIRSAVPSLPIVIMSGYFSRISPEKLAQLGHVSLLSKPFTNEELARTMHKALSPSNGAPTALV